MQQQPQHIALYVPSLRGGGAERVIVRLANEFVNRDYAVDIVLVKNKGEYLDDVSSSVSIVNLDTRRFLAAVPALIQYLRSARPDVLLSTIDSANVAAIIAGNVSFVDTRVIVRISNMLSSKEKALDHPKHKIVHWAAQQIYPFANHIIGVSNGVSEDVISYLEVDPNLVTTVYNPVINEALISLKKKSVGHPWFDDSNPVILAVGELSEQKDFQTLIRAFAIIDRTPEPRLVILGEGEKREALIHLSNELGVSDRIDLPGFVNNPYRYMSKCDAFVLSSKWEGCPNVLIEALACDAPVVSTNCPSGPNEILQNGSIAPLVPVGDTEKMAEKILETLDCDIDCSHYANYAERYRVENIADDYLTVLFPNKNVS
ncbi:glycosyl transferase [Halobacteriales archaeon QH_7_65_31]|nr:MAG: glycosyl transferase [Halobacteriales archaeon QH_7_65_31]